jgi:SAM-dependent methyltransferase
MTPLPPDFLARARSLEAAYLASEDPIRQSGFGGGAERWRTEREPILEAVEGDGDLLDIGCANGYLLRCLVDRGAERGLRLTPHGIDIGPRLVEEAKRWHPGLEGNFHVANGWDWRPRRRFRYVYSLYDCVPEDLLADYVRRLLERVVAPGGRLIVGAYGSRSAGTPPFAIAGFLAANGFAVAGLARGGDPPVAEFAWVDNVQ